jgi:hypothetical protein
MRVAWGESLAVVEQMLGSMEIIAVMAAAKLRDTFDRPSHLFNEHVTG